jgi:hypothetical protein
MGKLTTNQKSKMIIAFCFLLSFSSCVTKSDYKRCHLVYNGVVTVDTENYEDFDESGTYTMTRYYLFYDGNKSEFSGFVYPEKKWLKSGDSVFVFKDWENRVFVSSSSDIESAFVGYANHKLFTLWGIFGMIFTSLIMALNVFFLVYLILEFPIYRQHEESQIYVKKWVYWIIGFALFILITIICTYFFTSNFFDI